MNLGPLNNQLPSDGSVTEILIPVRAVKYEELAETLMVAEFIMNRAGLSTSKQHWQETVGRVNVSDFIEKHKGGPPILN